MESSLELDSGCLLVHKGDRFWNDFFYELKKRRVSGLCGVVLGDSEHQASQISTSEPMESTNYLHVEVFATMRSNLEFCLYILSLLASQVDV